MPSPADNLAAADSADDTPSFPTNSDELDIIEPGKMASHGAKDDVASSSVVGDLRQKKNLIYQEDGGHKQKNPQEEGRHRESDDGSESSRDGSRKSSREEMSRSNNGIEVITRISEPRTGPLRRCR